MNNKLSIEEIEHLSAASVDIVPIHYDWYDSISSGVHWDIVFPNVSGLSIKECQSILNDYGAELPPYHLKEFNTVETWQEYVQNADRSRWAIHFPIVNCYYDIPDSNMDIGLMQQAIRDMSFLIIKVDNKPKLSFYGGGYDMTWELCRVYMTLGFLPPFSCCNLPNIENHYDIEIIKACEKSISVMRKKCDASLLRLDALTRK